MSFSISVVKADIRTYLENVVFPGQDFFTQLVSDTVILKRDARGKVVPYVAFQFGDIRYAGNETFAGARSANYRIPIKGKIVVAGEDYDIGDGLRDRFYNLFYGSSFEWAGEIRPMEGISSEFPLRKSDGATEAIILPVGVGITTDMIDIPDL